MASIITLFQSIINYIRSIKFDCFCKCSNTNTNDPMTPCRKPNRSDSITVQPSSSEFNIPRPPNTYKRAMNPKSKLILKNSADFMKIGAPSDSCASFSLNMESSRRPT